MKKKQRKEQNPLPVTVLTGFLGAGKSTVLNRLLKEKPSEHWGVILNEFGLARLESQLVIKRKEPIFEMSSGCLCCVSNGDLQKAFKTLLDQDPQIGRIVVEASGLSSPGPLLSFLSDSKGDFILSGVLAVVDSQNFLDREKDQTMVKKQLQYASSILLTKTDLAGLDKKRQVQERLHEDWPNLQVFDTQDRLPWTVLFDYNNSAERNNLQEDSIIQGSRRFFKADRHHGVQIWEFESVAPLNLEAVKKTFDQLTPGILRAKGILYLKDKTSKNWKYIVQFTPGQKQLYSKSWESGEVKKTSLIFLGTDFDSTVLESSLKGTL